MVEETENSLVFLSLWYDKRFRFSITYQPFSFDVAEYVISRDEHEYYGNTMRHCFLLKRWGHGCRNGGAWRRHCLPGLWRGGQRGHRYPYI